jgi:phosphomannomutase
VSKTILAFDLDGTLAPSKSSLPPEMGKVLAALLLKYEICVISGGKFGQFQMQLINGLTADGKILGNLHIMPTCGTQCYRYDDGWKEIYAENFTAKEKDTIINALNAQIDALGLRESEVYGQIIEDRGSQITFSALGQDIVAELGDEGVRLKEEWDPDHSKKKALRDHVSALIPEFEVRVGGGTSIDITKPGIDKAYGMRKLMEMTGTTPNDIVFFGDRLEEGGNDFPVIATGIDTVAVTGWQDTLEKLRPYADQTT